MAVEFERSAASLRRRRGHQLRDLGRFGRRQFLRKAADFVKPRDVARGKGIERFGVLDRLDGVFRGFFLLGAGDGAMNIVGLALELVQVADRYLVTRGAALVSGPRCRSTSPMTFGVVMDVLADSPWKGPVLGCGEI